MPINVDKWADLAGEVSKVYEEAEMTMMRNISNRVYADPYSARWAEKKYSEMQDVNRSMQAFVGKLTSDRQDIQSRLVNMAYGESGKAFLNEAHEFGQLAGITHLTPNATKVINILTDLERRMDAADRNILRAANDAYANIVGRASALVATGTVTVREAVQREINDFANRGITSFVDVAGRHWDMETYSEMATLTAIERATLEGYTDAMEEFGFDLAEISSHFGACPVCEAWEGVIVSVTGETHGYPTLDDAENAGVFHPRCLHDISTYYDGISRPGRTTPREVKEPNIGYAARSDQRHFERMERAWKRRMAVAATPEEERKAYAHVRMYQGRITDLLQSYNSQMDSEVDKLYRKRWREGPQVTLSKAAAKLPPYQIPEGWQAKPVNMAELEAETSPNPELPLPF